MFTSIINELSGTIMAEPNEICMSNIDVMMNTKAAIQLLKKK